MKNLLKTLLTVMVFLLLASNQAGSQPVQKTGGLSTWLVYNTSNSGMPGNYIHDIKVDYVARVFFATGNGLAILDGSTWTVYNTSNSDIPSGLLRCIDFESFIITWVGTVSGLGRFDGVNWTNYYTYNSGLPDASIDDITVNALNGIKWISTDGGLAKFDDIDWTVYDHTNTPLTDDWIRCATIQNNTIWVGTEYVGMAKFDGGSGWTIYNTSNSDIPSNTVRSIAVDYNTGHIWVGTYYGGVADFDGTNWIVYNKNNSGLPNNSVRGISIDNNGVKWFATGGGLVRFDGINWTVYNTSNSGIPDNVLNCVWAVDADVWVGTDGEGAAVLVDGVVGLQDGKTLVHSVYPNPFTDQVKFEFTASQDQLTLLRLFDMTGREVFRKSYSFKANVPSQITIDGKNLSRGVYSYFLLSGNASATGKIIRE